MHILLNRIRRARRRLGRAWRRHLLVFPVATFVLATSGCTALQSREEIAWQALNAIDAAQTLNIVGDPCFREGHPLTRELIGERPDSRGRVLATMAGYAIAHAGITEYLLRTDRPRLAKLWSYVTLGEKAYHVGRNYHIGVRIGGANKTPAGCVR